MTINHSNFGRSIVVMTFLSACFGAQAAERAEACIKYEKEHGWSKSYTVQATVIEGSELNQKVGSYTRFKSFSTYAVVFWGEGQATVLELPSLSMGSLPMFEIEVKDQEGRHWKIKEGHLFCH